MPYLSAFRLRTLRCVLGAGVLCAVFASVPASAQNSGDPNWLNPDVIQLRDEVELLRREVERLAAGRAVNGDLPIGDQPSGDFFVRLDQVETESERLRAELDRVIFETDRAIDARDAQIAELNERLATLEEMMGVTNTGSNIGVPGAAPGVASAAGAATSGVALAPDLLENDGDARPVGSLGEIESGAPGSAITDQPVFENGAQPETPAVASGPAPTYEEALDLLRARDYEGAEQALTAFIAANPSDARIGEATYWLGETYYLGGEFDRAARSFLTSFRDHPTGAKAPDSLLRLGVTLAQLGRRDEACASFEQVSVRYPEAPERLRRRAQVEARRAGCPT